MVLPRLKIVALSLSLSLSLAQGPRTSMAVSPESPTYSGMELSSESPTYSGTYLSSPLRASRMPSETMRRAKIMDDNVHDPTCLSSYSGLSVSERADASGWTNVSELPDGLTSTDLKLGRGLDDMDGDGTHNQTLKTCAAATQMDAHRNHGIALTMGGGSNSGPNNIL